MELVGVDARTARLRLRHQIVVDCRRLAAGVQFFILRTFSPTLLRISCSSWRIFWRHQIDFGVAIRRGEGVQKRRSRTP